jgi:3-(3-hydroxy-phenyl)propionate hydroxylase
LLEGFEAPVQRDQILKIDWRQFSLSAVDVAAAPACRWEIKDRKMTARLDIEQVRQLMTPVSGPTGRGSLDADVVIVGAGPIGLTAANLLGSLGISTILLEQNEKTADLPKALAVDDEYMRLLDNVGIAKSLEAHTSPPFGIYFYSPLGPAIVKVMPFITSNGFGTRTGIMQPVFEKVLLAAAQRFECVDLQFRSAVTAVKQNRAGVTLSVKTASGEQKVVTARFVLACDGARSFVRSALQIAFEGTRIDEPHLVIDLAEFPDQSPYSRFFCNPERPLNSIPTPYGGRRLEFMLNPGDVYSEIASEESIRYLFKHHSPYGDVKPKIIRAVVYGFSERIAKHLQKDRIFLLGDAAHVMPPFGAQAMNTGARDANNICWKIAAVLSGKAAPALLDTYEPERRPQIEAIVRYSVWVGRLANLRNRFLAMARDIGFLAINCVPSVRRYFAEMRYLPKRPLTSGFLSRPGEPPKQSLLGKVFPRLEFESADKQSVSFDRLAGSDFMLVGIGLSPEEMRSSASHPLCRSFGARALAVELAGPPPSGDDLIEGVTLLGKDARERLSVHIGDVLLIRPDRYVAAAVPVGEAATAFDDLRQKFEPIRRTSTPSAGTYAA